jgi:hypothetical protein
LHLTTPDYDKKIIDHDAIKNIFLVNDDGQPDKARAAQYPTMEAWEESVRQETMETFADIDPNRKTAEQLAKVDAIAETIYENLKRGVKMYNAVPSYMDVRKGAIGKTLEAYETKGGKVYNRAYGGYMQISELRKEKFTLVTKPAAVHISLPVEALKTGRYSAADVVFAATQAIVLYKNRLAFDTFVAAYTTGSTGFVTNANSVAITDTVLKSAIDSLADYDVDSMTVLGRYSVLTPISDFTGYSDVALEEIRKKGFLGRWRGADILRLKYIVDEVYGGVPFDTSSVFVVSNEKSYARYVEAKPIERQSWIEPKDKTIHWTFDFEDGAAIWKLKYAHRIYNTV